jgi:glycerol-3-phosphate dehydrogenase (NAD(P)+)
MKTTVLGAGAFGTALAIQLARQGHATKVWTRSSQEAATLEARRENTRYLAGSACPTNFT